MSICCSAFSQEKATTKLPSTVTTTKTTIVKQKDTLKPTHCYTMMKGAMMHCMGAKSEIMKKDVTLMNGTTITTKGEVTTKSGTKSILTNGKAIDVNGKIGDFDKMHPVMRKN